MSCWKWNVSRAVMSIELMKGNPYSFVSASGSTSIPNCFANSTISRDFVKITTWILNCRLYNDSTRSEYFNFFETPYPHNETHTNT